MIVVPVLSLLVGVCFVAVYSEVPGEPSLGCVCTRNEYFIETSFNRTCKQELLTEVHYTVYHIASDVKQIANTTKVLQRDVAELAVAQETSTNELKYQLSEGFDDTYQKIDETNELIHSESAMTRTEHHRSIHSMQQELMTQMQYYHDNLTYQMTTINSDKYKKQQLVWALTECCVPLLIQQNVDGSDYFNRSWSEYKAGFYHSNGNYWLGNELISQLSQTGRYKLRFDLHKAHSDSWYYAEYHTFTVSGEAYNYQLHVSGYTGDTGYDALKSHDGMMFTTWDRDNDPWTKPQYNNNCAVFNGGGFWWTSYLGYCGGCDVNAVRDSGEDFSWDLERGQLKLQTSRMWLQCKYPLSHHSK